MYWYQVYVTCSVRHPLERFKNFTVQPNTAAPPFMKSTLMCTNSLLPTGKCWKLSARKTHKDTDVPHGHGPANK
jgi:hypothetical protein